MAMKDDPFEIAERYQNGAERRQPEPSIDLSEGRITAIKICSEILQVDVWLAFDDSFDPRDDQAVFYPDEFEFLKTKTPEQLREIYNVKLMFPGCRVRQ
jgi:hypothetical protein